MQTKPFLSAEWRKLAIANYSVDPKILEKYLPAKTELDYWQDTCYISLVGFMFLETKLKGIKIPFHVNFEEINLRFYVKYKDENHVWKRGVVFIKEIVPKPALAFIANTIYNENYSVMPTKHVFLVDSEKITVQYSWKSDRCNSIKVEADSHPQLIKENSEEEFITEHYWGYTRINENNTSEYGVEHPKWEIYDVLDYNINVDFQKVYGQEFSFLNSVKPDSVMLAEGSEIIVRGGRIL